MITPGCPLKPGAEATKPTTLTMRVTLSMPTSASMAASAFSAHVRAATRACSGLTSAPALPVWVSLPSTSGSWPAV